MKNQFINNLSVTEEKITFFKYLWLIIFNRYEKMKIIWFINLNQSSDINPANSFY